MRENAESAVLATGDEPWWFEGIGWNDVYGTTYTVHSKAGAHVCDAGTEERAEHVASWHPAVALAVADLLDELARKCDLVTGGHICFEDEVAALAVATAYLGEDQ
jgi:hypothetical protein